MHKLARKFESGLLPKFHHSLYFFLIFCLRDGRVPRRRMPALAGELKATKLQVGALWGLTFEPPP